MNERPKFSEFEIGNVETKNPLDSVTDEIFGICDKANPVSSRLTTQGVSAQQCRVVGARSGSDSLGNVRAQL